MGISGGGGVRPARYSARGRTSHSAVESDDLVQSHHARGACESVGVGAKIGSSGVVDTHLLNIDQTGFALKSIQKHLDIGIDTFFSYFFNKVQPEILPRFSQR